MITLAKYTNKEILPFIGQGRPRREFVTESGIYNVNMASHRLAVLKRSQTCVRCKTVGTTWMLQSHQVNLPQVGHNCFIRQCPWCSLRPRHYRPVTESPGPSFSPPHLNLYSKVKGKGWVLMTQDHIFPRHAGGGNGLNNLQTMCSTCNSYKGGMLPSEYEKVMQDEGRNQYARQVARGSLGPKGLYPHPLHDLVPSHSAECGAK